MRLIHTNIKYKIIIHLNNTTCHKHNITNNNGNGQRTLKFMDTYILKMKYV
jgi:hypothetical protein